MLVVCRDHVVRNRESRTRKLRKKFASNHSQIKKRKKKDTMIVTAKLNDKNKKFCHTKK